MNTKLYMFQDNTDWWVARDFADATKLYESLYDLNRVCEGYAEKNDPTEGWTQLDGNTELRVYFECREDAQRAAPPQASIVHENDDDYYTAIATCDDWINHCGRQNTPIATTEW